MVGGKTSMRLGCCIDDRLLIYKRNMRTDQVVAEEQKVYPTIMGTRAIEQGINKQTNK